MKPSSATQRLSSAAAAAAAIALPAPNLLDLLLFLPPSFVQHGLRPADSKVPRRPSLTAWLDGLRGAACCIVFLWHYTEANLPWYLQPFGVPAPGDAAASSPLQLPWLRVLFAGPAMVHVFVVSGYSLAYRPLLHVRSRDSVALASSLSSSIFRRSFRLFLPPMAATFIMCLVRCGGWFDALPVMRLPSLVGQLRDWLDAVWRISLFWCAENFDMLPYNLHLWIVSIEFSHSMGLYLVIAGLGRLKTFCRFAFLLVIMLYTLLSGHWAPFEFLAGMGLAEISIIQQQQQPRQHVLPTSSRDAEPSHASLPSRLLALVLVFGLVFGLFVAGWPARDLDRAPVLSVLRRYTPHLFLPDRADSFWHALASVQMTAAIQQFDTLRALFTIPLAQYLGRISFSLYLVHGPMLIVLVSHYLPFLWHLVGGRDAAIVTVPIVWVADVFTRLVDAESIRFARWLESACLHQDPAGSPASLQRDAHIPPARPREEQRIRI